MFCWPVNGEINSHSGRSRRVGIIYRIAAGAVAIGIGKAIENIIILAADKSIAARMAIVVLHLAAADCVVSNAGVIEENSVECVRVV